MKKFYSLFFFAILIGAAATSKAQKIDSIYFNLYTDSLKKGVHNYINVIGKISDGSYLPLMESDLVFKSSAGKWQGNSLIIDSSFNADSIVVFATLKSQPVTTRSIVIYMKKNLVEPALPTEEELMEGWKKSKKKQ